MTRVLPLPAPANIRAGPSRYNTASRCLSFKLESNTAISPTFKCLRGQPLKYRCGAFFVRAAQASDPTPAKIVAKQPAKGFPPTVVRAHDQPPAHYATAQGHTLGSVPSPEPAAIAPPSDVPAAKNPKIV